jgi:hypothetical protein
MFKAHSEAQIKKACTTELSKIIVSLVSFVTNVSANLKKNPTKFQSQMLRGFFFSKSVKI